MNEEKTLGQELIDAIDEAIKSPQRGRIVCTPINVKNLRQKLHLTQKEFSNVYHINLETLKNWEQEKRIPDSTSILLLACIDNNPVVMRDIISHL